MYEGKPEGCPCGLCCREMMPDCKYLTEKGCVAGDRKPPECKDFYCETHPIKTYKYLIKE